MSLGQALQTLSNATSRITSAAVASLLPIATLDDTKLATALGNAALKLTPTVRRMALETYRAAGIQSHTHVMERALAGLMVKVTPDGFTTYFPPGINYPDGRGDINAASGALKYGADRNGTKIAPKSGFMYLTDQQHDVLRAQWAALVATELRRVGLPIRGAV